MSFPLYLIRHSAHTLSPWLYSSKDLNVSACTLRTSNNSPSSEQQAGAFRATSGDDGAEGQTMTYEHLLDVIMKASKVIIL
jgi:hypothetical protein